MKMHTIISLLITFLVVIFVGSYAYSTIFGVSFCEDKFDGCEVYKCKAEKASSVFHSNNYLLEEQNCLLREEINKLNDEEIKE